MACKVGVFIGVLVSGKGSDSGEKNPAVPVKGIAPMHESDGSRVEAPKKEHP
jgi:hypothetical protein